MGLTCNEEAEWRAEWRAERHETARFGGCAVVHVARREGGIPATKHCGADGGCSMRERQSIFPSKARAPWRRRAEAKVA